MEPKPADCPGWHEDAATEAEGRVHDRTHRSSGSCPTSCGMLYKSAWRGPRRGSRKGGGGASSPGDRLIPTRHTCSQALPRAASVTALSPPSRGCMAPHPTVALSVSRAVRSMKSAEMPSVGIGSWCATKSLSAPFYRPSVRCWTKSCQRAPSTRPRIVSKRRVNSRKTDNLRSNETSDTWPLSSRSSGGTEPRPIVQSLLFPLGQSGRSPNTASPVR